MKENRSRGDYLIQALLEDIEDDERRGALALELLSEVFSGYPTDKLRQLLRSRNESTVKSAGFIVSEMGVDGVELLDDVAPLLDHPSRWGRIYAIESVLHWARADDGLAVARAIELLLDDDSGVRVSVMTGLVKAPSENILKGVPHLRNADIQDATVWLRNVSIDRVDPDEIIRRLTSPSEIERRFAAVAAGRVCKSDPRARDVAQSSDDSDVRRFARSVLSTP